MGGRPSSTGTNPQAANIIKLIKLIQSAGLESDKLTALMASLAGTSYSASLAFAVQNAGDLDRLLAEAGMSAGEMDRQIDIIFSGFFGSLQKIAGDVGHVRQSAF